MSSLTRRLLSVVFGTAVLAAGAAEAGPADGRPGHIVTPSGFSVPVYGTQLVRGADGRMTTTCSRLSDAQIDSLYSRSQTARSMMASERQQMVKAAGVGFTIVYSDADGVGFKDPELGPVRTAAFEATAAAWSNALGGGIPIVIDVRMESDNPDLLATAGPSDYVIREDRVLPFALAAQILNTSVNGGATDIQARFNPNHNWDYDLSGNAAEGKVSFVYTALHEIAHGLGFLSLFEPETGRVATPLPGPFDFWMNRSTADGNRLVNRAPADVMADVLSGDLYFAGPIAIQASLASVRPLPMVKLYAPAAWEPASSISHVDQETYSDPSVGLMRPNDVGGVGANVVDALTAAILLDLGYPAPAPVLPAGGR